MLLTHDQIQMISEQFSGEVTGYLGLYFSSHPGE